MHADVDHGRARFDHVAGDQLGHARGRDQDVGASACGPAGRAVFTWVIVTVAFPRIESCASMIESGAPTRSPYPTTTTSAPSSGMPLRSSSSTIPYGVAGWNAGSPRTHHADVPWDGGRRRPSRASIVRWTSSSWRCCRQRQLDDDPVDLRVAVQPAERGEQLALGHVGGQVDLLASGSRRRHTPCAWRRRRCERPGRRPPGRRPGPGSRRCSESARTRSATSERICAATALPSRIRAVTRRQSYPRAGACDERAGQ